MAAAGEPESPSGEYFDMLHDKHQGDIKNVQRTYDELSSLTEDGEHQNNAKLLWRLARACFDLQDCKLDDKEWCEQRIRQGIAIGDRGCKADPECGLAHKWAAIMLGTLDPFVGTSEKIANAHKLKQHADKAHALRPEDGMVCIILTEFCMSVANIGWLQRKAAAVIFGSPPESDFKEALTYALRCTELEMKKTKRKRKSDDADSEIGTLMARSAKNVGLCYIQLGDKEKAKEWFERAQLVNCSTETDRTHQVAAKKALDKL